MSAKLIALIVAVLSVMAASISFGATRTRKASSVGSWNDLNNRVEGAAPVGGGKLRCGLGFRRAHGDGIWVDTAIR